MTQRKTATLGQRLYSFQAGYLNDSAARPGIQDRSANVNNLQTLLRVTRLVNRFGMTPAQAAMVAGLAWGEA
jgi:hypothetical protein